MGTERIALGNTDIQVLPLGVGTWAWGDRGYWGYGKSYGEQDITEAFVVSVNKGITLFDTAEIYGGGTSERLLGNLIRQTKAPVVIATKFSPLPWRLTLGSLPQALDASLSRLGVETIDLYQIHHPYSILSIEALMDALADAVADGKVRAVGVSNYGAEHIRRAHAALAKRGVPLASNQVNYSLLKRTPEKNGVLDTCRELGVTLIAYSPLAGGLLTGKYTARQRPSGPRFFLSAMTRMECIERVVDTLRQIGQDHGGKTPSQVAMNWLIAQGNVLPIPGAKNRKQATDNAGVLGWALTPAQVEAIDEATRSWR
ncbi:MAG: aldo/keto reductase [Chloroflexaceae bacterium]|nr:aldo/keto reductase [Chloroflexaceae bacterium]